MKLPQSLSVVYWNSLAIWKKPVNIYTKGTSISQIILQIRGAWTFFLILHENMGYVCPLEAHLQGPYRDQGASNEYPQRMFFLLKKENTNIININDNIEEHLINLVLSILRNHFSVNIERFNSCPKLQALNLRGNSIHEVSALESNRHLWRLDLSNNKVIL